MRLVRTQKTHLNNLALVVALASPMINQTWAAPSSQKAPSHIELGDRAADEVALGFQISAADKFEELAKRDRNKDKVLPLLMREVDILEQATEISFRLAYEDTRKLTTREKQNRVGRYEHTRQRLIRTLDDILARFKLDIETSNDLQKARYIRGAQLQGLERFNEASADFIFLIDNFPRGYYLIPATLHLAEMASQRGDYKLAIQYLEKLQIKSTEVRYQEVMERLADAYFNAGNVVAALKTNEAKITALNTFSGQTSKQADIERILKISAGYYSRARDTDPKTYSLANALEYFTKWGGPLSSGKALIAFTYNIRVKEFDDEMIQWNHLIQKQNLPFPQSMEQSEISLIVVEYLIGKRLYAEAEIETLSYLAGPVRKTLSEPERIAMDVRIKSLALKTSAKLVAVVSKTTHPDDIKATQTYIAAFYEIALMTSQPKDKDIAQIHYNRGESYFALKLFDKATQDYRFVADRLSLTEPLSRESHLKALSSRYEALKGRGLIPQSLSASSFKQEKHDAIDPALSEWIQWIEYSQKRLSEYASELDTFRFESYRAMYAQGKISLAVEQLHEFIKERPNSKQLVASATLVMDTWITSQDWVGTERLAREYLKMSQIKSSSYEASLREHLADAVLKQAEVAYSLKNYQEALDQSQRYLKEFTHGKTEIALTMAASSAVQVKNKPLALDLLSVLIKNYPAATGRAATLKIRSSLYEESLRFDLAYADLYKAISVDDPDQASAQKSDRAHALKLAVLTGQDSLLSEALSSPHLCRAPNVDNALDETCSRYGLLVKTWSLFSQMSQKTISPSQSREHLRMARNRQNSNRLLYALVALENSGNMFFSDTLELIEITIAQWAEFGKTDPLAQSTLLPRLSKSLSGALFSARIGLEKMSKIRADESSIKRRIEYIKNYEKAAKMALEFPFNRIQTAATAELGLLYMSTYADLKAVAPTLPQLFEPFKTKAKDLEKASEKLISESAVEESQANTLAKLQTTLADGQIPAISQWISMVTVGDLDYEWVAKLIGTSTSKKDQDFAKDWLREWKQAAAGVSTKSYSGPAWARIWSLLGIAKAHPELDAAGVAMAQAYSFSKAGARSEGINSLWPHLSVIKKSKLPQASYAIISSYFRSYAKERVSKSVGALARSLSDSDSELRTLSLESQVTIGLAGIWTNQPLPKQDQNELLAKIEDIPVSQRKPIVKSYYDFVKKNKELFLSMRGEK